MLIDTIEEFYIANKQGLYTYALSLVCDDHLAEDVVHTSIMKVIQNNKLPQNLKSYIYKIVRNTAMDLWRNTKKENCCIFENDFLLNEDEDKSPFEIEQLQNSLDCLDSHQREVIILKIYDNLTFDEIATIKEISINTVASWYRRGLKKLKTTLRRGEN